MSAVPLPLRHGIAAPPSAVPLPRHARYHPRPRRLLTAPSSLLGPMTYWTSPPRSAATAATATRTQVTAPSRDRKGEIRRWISSRCFLDLAVSFPTRFLSHCFVHAAS